MPHLPRADIEGGRTVVASGLLAMVGIAIASYLTIVHYREDFLVCAIGGGCHTVQSSSFATALGVPVALLGLGMYLALLGMAGIRLVNPALREPVTMVAFTLALSGVVYAAYLTYAELFVINAVCPWCVASAIVTVAICLVEGFEVWRMLGLQPVLDE